ncbi:PepSY domain-containing protein [Thermaurantiacus sp.]
MSEVFSRGGGRALLAAALVACGTQFLFFAPALAQSSGSRAAVEARGRPVSDQDVARAARESGEYRSLEDLLAIAGREGRGRYLGVETSSPVYRFKFRREAGEVVWVDVDARSGRVVRIQP